MLDFPLPSIDNALEKKCNEFIHLFKKKTQYKSSNKVINDNHQMK